MKSLSVQDRADVTGLMAYQTTELGNQGQREMISRAAGTVGRAEQMGPGVGADAISAKLAGGAGGTGRMGDNTVAAMAGDAGTVLKNFNDMRSGMDAAARSAAAFTDQIRMLNAELMRALESKDLGAANDVWKRITQATGNKTQVQAGKQGQ